MSTQITPRGKKVLAGLVVAVALAGVCRFRKRLAPDRPVVTGGERGLPEEVTQ